MNVFSVVENIKQIDLTLAVISPRVINNGACIKYQNKTYYPEKQGVRIYFARRTKALVIKSLSGKL